MGSEGTNRTDAYLKLKEQTQKSFDFAYIVSQSVPCLKLQCGLVEKGTITSLPIPDYFKVPNGLTIIREQAKEYKLELCKHILLSSFSYFEAYINNVCQEFLDFHGGSEFFQNKTKDNFMAIIKRQNGKHVTLKRHLQKDEAKKRTKVFASSLELKQAGYIFPSKLMFHIGLKSMVHRLANLKSVGIPEFTEDAFGYCFTEEQKGEFHAIRDIRNNIAHGGKVTLDLGKVAAYNTTLREIALGFDRHLVDLFLLCERHG